MINYKNILRRLGFIYAIVLMYSVIKVYYSSSSTKHAYINNKGWPCSSLTNVLSSPRNCP